MTWILMLFLLPLNCAKAPKTYRVGILSGLDFFLETETGFRQKLSELGYKEGTDIVYELHRTNFDPGTEREVLQRYCEQKVDLILAFPTEVALQAKQVARGSGIPVVFANAIIEGADLVEDIREPGGNVTGVRFPGPDIAVKRLEILRTILPHVTRILVPYQQGYPTIESQLEMLRPVAESVGITFTFIAANDAADLSDQLSKLTEGGNNLAQAILIIPEPLLVSNEGFAAISAFAAKQKIPIGGALSIGDERVSLFGVAIDNAAVGRQAAVLADKIFHGVPAGTIPVVSAETYIQVDVVAARQFGVEIPNGLLKQADAILR
ncbi:MAG: ABC transporter substrate-binding protein [Bacteroidetes bacterium]|nr:ABC transporter substrate-binding protein [Bacteroidota bacterium]